MKLKKKISIVTATRAEYGLLRPLIKKLIAISSFDVRVAVTGAHLSPEFGLTYKEIEGDGIQVDKKIEILLSADTPSAISKSMGLAMISFADYFAELKPDLLVILGDRYEALAVTAAAMNERIPVAHLHGGETGNGTVDNMVRHAITKMSSLHFTSTEEHRNRVIQLGEHPSKVYNVGALGVENIKSLELLHKAALEEILDFQIDEKTILVTYHPLSLSENSALEFSIMLEALKKIDGLRIIFTKANADAGGRVINQMIDDFVRSNETYSKAFTSLGTLKYLSTLKYVRAVVGNSSSGLIEAPSLNTYTLNIGDRQRGRVSGKSVLHCDLDTNEIYDKLIAILSLNKETNFENPYEKDNTSSNITEIIYKRLYEGLDTDKDFFDLEARNDINK